MTMYGLFGELLGTIIFTGHFLSKWLFDNPQEQRQFHDPLIRTTNFSRVILLRAKTVGHGE